MTTTMTKTTTKTTTTTTTKTKKKTTRNIMTTAVRKTNACPAKYGLSIAQVGSIRTARDGFHHLAKQPYYSVRFKAT